MAHPLAAPPRCPCEPGCTLSWPRRLPARAPAESPAGFTNSSRPSHAPFTSPASIAARYHRSAVCVSPRSACSAPPASLCAACSTCTNPADTPGETTAPAAPDPGRRAFFRAEGRARDKRLKSTHRRNDYALSAFADINGAGGRRARMQRHTHALTHSRTHALQYRVSIPRTTRYVSRAISSSSSVGMTKARTRDPSRPISAVTPSCAAAFRCLRSAIRLC